MKVLLAYGLTLLLAATVGAIVGLLTLPLLATLGRQAAGIGIVIAGGLETLCVVWFSIHIFFWLGLQPRMTLLFVLGAGYVLHNLQRIAAAQNDAMSSFRINHLLGDIVGLSLGGLLMMR